MHRDAIDGSVRIARSTLKRSMDRWIIVIMKIVAFAILAVAIVSGIEANPSKESCTPGERIMKDCNTCICIDGVSYACTTMACVTGLTCRPGKSFKHYCNVCRCPSNGLAQSAACTKNVCVEGMFNKDGTLKSPFSDPISRDEREVNWSEGTCEPGKTFKHYCNNCRCGADGLVKSAACTKMACPEGMFKEDGTRNEPLGRPFARNKRQVTCEPGKTFKKFCNSCTCGTDASVESAACTRMECVPGMWNEDGSLKEPLPDPIPRNKRQVTCEPGKTFKKFCNSCTCGTDASIESAACTRMECVPGMWNEDGSLKEPLTDPIPRDKRQADSADATCVPGTSYNYYCNTCRCGTDGLRKTAMCTRAECPESMWNEDGSLKEPLTDPIPRDKRQADGADATCVPGSSFNWYCNTCRCGDDGMRKSAGCTRKGCPEGVYNEDGTLKQPLSDPIPRNKRQVAGTAATCEPGTSFKQYCNTCHCPPSGLRDSAACTLMGCQEGMWNEDGTLANPDPTPRDKRQADVADATCEPGTSFKLFCNTCHCPANGLRASAGCTAMACPHGVWNEDGSLKEPLSDPVPRDKRQAGVAGATCIPGTSFRQYCNTCQCPSNGLRISAPCTLMACLEGMWNEDGTLPKPGRHPRNKRQANGGDDSTDRKVWE